MRAALKLLGQSHSVSKPTLTPTPTPDNVTVPKVSRLRNTRSTDRTRLQDSLPKNVGSNVARAMLYGRVARDPLPGFRAPDPVFPSKEEIEKRVRGVVRPLQDLLQKALESYADPERLRLALDFLADIKHAKSPGHVPLGCLLGAGCLVDADLDNCTSFVEGSDPVLTLAMRQLARKAVAQQEMKELPRALFDYPGRVEQILPLLAGEKFDLDVKDLGHRRGQVGEALRLMEVRQDPSLKDCEIVQGILVVRVPAELKNIDRPEKVREWCQATGHSVHGIYRWEEGGRSHYGYLEGEIDVSIFEKKDNLLKPIRLDSVKSGIGSSRAAQKQNEQARDALTDPECVYLFPEGDGYVDRSEELNRSPATQSQLQLLSVGPWEDPYYDHSLPLTTGDITWVAELLSQGGSVAPAR